MNVTLTKHIAKESFPLRLGYEAETHSFIDLLEPRLVTGGKGDCKNYVAGIQNPTTGLVDKLTCVVSSDGMLVTAFFGDNKDEIGLSKITKNLPIETLLELYPYYKKGYANDFTALMTKIREIDLEPKVIEINRLQKIIDDFNKQASDVEKQTRRQGAKWIESEFRARGMLDDVKIVLRWNNYKNTNEEYLMLVFVDGSQLQTKWDSKSFLARKAAYLNMKGHFIETTVSNTNDPTYNYSGSEWFNRVRIVE